jgi:hypothetical protein
MFNGLSVETNSLGLCSIPSAELLYFILPSYSNDLDQSMYLHALIFDILAAWLRQISTSPKFFN